MKVNVFNDNGRSEINARLTAGIEISARCSIKVYSIFFLGSKNVKSVREFIFVFISAANNTK